MGVTSLVTNTQQDGNKIQEVIIAGTKNGEVFLFHNNNNNNNKSKKQQARWTPLIMTNNKSSKFPIYSIATATSTNRDVQNAPTGNNNNNNNRSSNNKKTKHMIFCGGGDRYISVWETKPAAATTISSSAAALEGGENEDKTTKRQQEQEQQQPFQMVQRLGPHTGWVKDMVYDDSNGYLFSIGCNCIEAWDCCTNEQIQSLRKRSIENSPTQGSTLSSDLLCLCLIQRKNWLLSGGVDGRIHIWSLSNWKTTSNTKPLTSLRVHNGRVTSLVYSSALQTFFSIGHDGIVNAFDTNTLSSLLSSSSPPPSSSSPSFSSSLFESKLQFHNRPRLTTISLVQERTQKSCQLMVGTTHGQIIFVDVLYDPSTKRIHMLHRKTIQLKGNPVIYSLCTTTTILIKHNIDLMDQNTINNNNSSSSNKTKIMILVGHANGIDTIDIVS